MIDPSAPPEAVRADAVTRDVSPRSIHLCVDMQNLIGPLQRRMQEGGIAGLVEHDLGYPVVVAADAICSGFDTAHAAALRLYGQRFSQQVQTMDVAEVRAAWRPA
jgi:hypothetical protein